MQTYAHRTLLAWIGLHIWRDHPVLGAGWEAASDPDVFVPYLPAAHRHFPTEPALAFPTRSHPYNVQNVWIEALADPEAWQSTPVEGHWMALVISTVIDDYHGRGVGGLLLDVAVLDGFAHGVDRFEGLVLGENISSRRMLARGGATFRPEGGGVLAFRLLLRPRADLQRLRLAVSWNRRGPSGPLQAKGDRGEG